MGVSKVTHRRGCGPTPEPKKLSVGIWGTLVSLVKCYRLNKEISKSECDLSKLYTSILKAKGDEAVSESEQNSI